MDLKYQHLLFILQIQNIHNKYIYIIIHLI